MGQRDDVALGYLIQNLQTLVDTWRKDAADYTGVMYYNEGDRERDLGRRSGMLNAADELQGVLDGYYYN